MIGPRGKQQEDVDYVLTITGGFEITGEVTYIVGSLQTLRTLR